MRDFNVSPTCIAHSNKECSIKNLTDGRRKPGRRPVKGLIFASLLAFSALTNNVSGQCVATGIVNHSFNSGTNADFTATNIGSAFSASNATSTLTGTAATNFGFTNTAGNGISQSYPGTAGQTTRTFTFTITGSNLKNYKSFQVFFQANRSATNVGDITVDYSKDGGAFGNSTTVTISSNNTWISSGVLSLPASFDNASTSIAIRLSATRPTVILSGSATIAIDNFMVQATRGPLAPSTTGTTICPGTSASITSSANGTATVDWFCNSTGGSGIGSGSSFSPSNGTCGYNNTVAGTYTFYAGSNFSGCPSTGRTAATITVSAPVGVTALATPSLICAGSSSQLNATFSNGTSPFTISWTPSTFLSSATISNPVANGVTGNTTYTVNVTDACGNTASATASINVNSLPSITINPVPSSATICGSGSVSLTANGANTYSWAPAAGLSTTTGTTITASPLVTTTYTVTGTSSAGCTSTQTISVKYSSPFTVTASANPSTVCFNGNSQLQASAGNTSNYTVSANTLTPVSTSGLTAGSYSTSPNGDDVLSNAVPVGFSFSFYGNTYSTFVISTNGNIQFGNPPTSAAWTPQAIPNSSTPTSGGNTGINNYIALAWRDWTTVGNGDIKYYTTGSAPNRICIIDFNDATHYVGQIILHETNNIIDIISTNIPANTSVQGIENFGGTAGVAVPGRNNVSWSSTSVTSYTFTPSGGAFTYSWSPSTFLTSSSISNPLAQNVTAGATYIATASDVNGCTATQSIAVSIAVSLTCNAPSVPSVSCAGSVFTLSANPSNGKTPYTYLWNTGATTSGINDNQPAGTYSYTVTITDVCGNSCSSSGSVTVNPLPVVTINSLPGSATICGSGSVLLTAGGADTYSWAPSTGLSATVGASVSASPASTTIYTVTGTSLSGCTSTQTISVKYVQAISIASSANPTDVCYNGNSNLIAAATYINPYTVSSIPFGFTSSGAFNSVTLGNDAMSGAITLPFTFKFYGIDYTQIFVSSNGYVQLGTNSNSNSVYGQTLPAATAPNNIIAGVWADLDPSASGTIRTWVTGTAPNRTFTIQYNGVKILGFSILNTPTATFQIQLKENGNAEVHIQSVVQPNLIPNAANTTLAIKNINGSVFNAPAGRFNNGNWNVSSSEAYRFTQSNGTYDFTWSPSTFLNSSTISNPLAQNVTASTTYTITATDVNGCSASNSLAITTSQLICSTPAVNGSVCAGSNFSITTNHSGGRSPYTYTWNTGASTSVINDSKPAGSYLYTVTVTDNCGNTCSSSVTVVINLFQPYMAEGDSVLCSNDAGFNMHVLDAGVFSGGYPVGTIFNFYGAGAILYQSSTSSTFFNANNTDAFYAEVILPGYAGGCSALSDTSVVDFSSAQAPQYILTADSVQCYGNPSGKAMAQILFGGTQRFRWQWYNSGNVLVRDVTDTAHVDTLSGVPGGMYTLVLTDHQDSLTQPYCSITDSVLIGQSSAPLAVTDYILNHADVLCNGNSTGSIDITVTGGTTPYSYHWSNGATTEDISGLIAGTYNCTVTDMRGCMVTIGITIAEPPALGINPAIADVLCNGGTGSIEVNVSGGVSPYSYSWSNGNNTESNNSLSAGTYTVTVTDANGCVTGNSYIINEPALLSLNCNSANNSCFNSNDGTVNATVAGGTTPYSYLWSNGSLSSSQNSLAAGTYTVTVTDSNGCTIQSTSTVTQPQLLTSSISSVNILCNGNSTGSIDIDIAGGTVPYSYNWNNSASTEDITGLPAGSYNCIITDSQGCTLAIAIPVTEPAPLEINPIVTHVLCNGGTGSVVINVSGGVSPYSYNWSNGGNSQSSAGITAGTYTVTVTDANGCTLSSSYTVNEPAALNLNCSSTNISCFDSDNGTVNAAVTGGTAPYFYLWSNGSLSSSQNSLPPGTYTVTVIDYHGCSIQSTSTITEPSLLSASVLSLTNPTSAFPLSGAININVNGGTTGYSYLWNNGSSTQSLSSLPAGTYTVTVTDAHGCSVSVSSTLQVTCILGYSNQVVQPPSCGKNNGIATVTVSGGTSYTYAWQTTPVQTTATATGLAYYNNSLLVITDVSGCTITDTVVLPTSNGLVLTLTSPVFAGGYSIRCHGGNTGSVNLTVGGSTGPYSYLWNNGATTQNLTGLAAGTYVVTVSNGGCTNMNLITLTQPSVLVANITKVNPTCFGSNNGTATVTPSGGVVPYTYSWNTSPVKTSATATGLPAGNYIVTVSDANGCTKTALTSLTQPAAMSITGVTTNINCNGGTNGSIDITISGGTPPYNYLWTGGATTQDRINVLATGTYTVTVTDSRGCTVQYSSTVTQPTAITASSTSTNVSCFGGNNGTGSVTASGGSPSYSYSWNTAPPKSTASVTGLKKGLYTVIITDSHGCLKAVTVNITEPSAINISISKVNVSFPGGGNGSATANVSGGVLPYSYLWNTVPVKTSQTASGLHAGTYTVTVTDANGCTKTANVVITQPSPRLTGDMQSNTVSNSIVFPNPSTGKFTVSFDETISTNVNMQVYSLTGERVFLNEIKVRENASSFDLDLSELPRGLYLIHYSTRDKAWIEKISIE